MNKMERNSSCPSTEKCFTPALVKYSVVGIELNSSRLKAVKEGWVYGKATPIRIGRTIQVWDIIINNEKNDIVCKSRLTLAVIKKNDK